MPGAGGRKKPFSGKQKKQQLLAKRERQGDKVLDEDGVLRRGPGTSRAAGGGA